MSYDIDICATPLPGRCTAAVCAGGLGGGRLHDGRAGRCHQAAVEGRRCSSLLQPLPRISAQRLGSIVSHKHAHTNNRGSSCSQNCESPTEKSQWSHTPVYDFKRQSLPHQNDWTHKLLPFHCEHTKSCCHKLANTSSLSPQRAESNSSMHQSGLLHCQYLPSSAKPEEQGLDGPLNL